MGREEYVDLVRFEISFRTLEHRQRIRSSAQRTCRGSEQVDTCQVRLEFVLSRETQVCDVVENGCGGFCVQAVRVDLASQECVEARHDESLSLELLRKVPADNVADFMTHHECQLVLAHQRRDRGREEQVPAWDCEGVDFTRVEQRDGEVDVRVDRTDVVEQIIEERLGLTIA